MAGANGNVEVLKATGATYTPVQLAVPINTGQDTGGVAMTPDGSRIAIVTDNGYSVQVRDADTGTVQQTLSPKNAIEAIDMNRGRKDRGRRLPWPGRAVDGQERETAHARHAWRLPHRYRLQRERERIRDGVYGRGRHRLGHKQRSRCPVDQKPLPGAFHSCIQPQRVDDRGGLRGRHRPGLRRGQWPVTRRAAGHHRGSGLFADFSPDGNSIIATVNAVNIGFIQVWNAELATTSLPKLEQIARQRVTQQLTPAQRQEYMPGF